ncbi:hypothetical protein DENIS_1822 [Desulfonema ishimotonii]|uniref:Uncharacterized protein n=1 Tax=Desulfonema ishimotonii TaxID=45657 RepID=A0A401FV85_9BACT|nr:hypothetical protein [Desulfonema ishimotonii]GBC60863.1 hypothetical protein DENIS_1822 [Desulfonema ishimotonii]
MIAMFLKPIGLLTVSALFFVTVSCASTLYLISWIGADASVTRTGELASPEISEASGLAASQIRDDLLWVLNDSGNGPHLFAITPKGKHLGTLIIGGAQNYDWEDLAAFEDEGNPCLLIADVGDNRARRNRCFLYIIREPEIKKWPASGVFSVPLVRTITFSYEDGPHDCEAVAVDMNSRRILLLTKRESPPVLYELPLNSAKKSAVLLARRRGEITAIPQPTEAEIRSGKYYKYHSLPTGMDIAPDGMSMIILTYRHAYLCSSAPDGDWKASLARPPRMIRLPLLPQAEAVCFSRDSRAAYVTSEKLPAPILRIDVADMNR